MNMNIALVILLAIAAFGYILDIFIIFFRGAYKRKKYTIIAKFILLTLCIWGIDKLANHI